MLRSRFSGIVANIYQSATTTEVATTSLRSGYATGLRTDWDWAFVMGSKPGRKPAIKRPQRHQWLFCNPNYNPNDPLPDRILPPHAPAGASEVDDWQVFNASLSGKLRGGGAKARAEFVRYLKLRDVDWRDAFHRGLAEHVTEFKKQQRVKAEKMRQDAWREFKEGVFAQALKSKQSQQESQ